MNFRVLARLTAPIILLYLLFLFTGEGMQVAWVFVLLIIIVLVSLAPYLYSVYRRKNTPSATAKPKSKEDLIREKTNAQKLLLDPIHNPEMVQWWNLQPLDKKREFIEVYYNRQNATNMWWEALPAEEKVMLASTIAKSDHIDLSQRDINKIYKIKGKDERLNSYMDDMSIQGWWGNNSFLRKEQMILLSNKMSAMEYFSK